MYVCLCKAVTQQQLQQAVADGHNYAEIRERLGVGTDCGCCGQLAKNMVRQHNHASMVCEYAAAS